MFFTKGEPERHSAFGMTPTASANSALEVEYTTSSG